MGWKQIWIPQLLVMPILVWGIFIGEPHRYYTYAKWFACLVFLSISGECSFGDRNLWSFMWLVIAIVYCPLLNIGFLEKNWYYINISTLAITVLSLLVGMGYMVNTEQENLSQMPPTSDTHEYSTKDYTPIINDYSKEVEYFMKADLEALDSVRLYGIHQALILMPPDTPNRNVLLSRVDVILKKRGY